MNNLFKKVGKGNLTGMQKIFLFLLTLLNFTSAFAADYSKSISEIPINQCKIERLVSFQGEYNLHKSVEFGSQSKPLIDEIEKILSKTREISDLQDRLERVK